MYVCSANCPNEYKSMTRIQHNLSAWEESIFTHKNYLNRLRTLKIPGFPMPEFTFLLAYTNGQHWPRYNGEKRKYTMLELYR